MVRGFLLAVMVCGLTLASAAQSAPSQTSPANSSSSGNSSSTDKKHIKPAPHSDLDAGAVIDGVYRNKTLGMTWKLPEGWVLRTDEMNADDETHPPAEDAGRVGQPQQAPQHDAAGSKVLLAAFSRPPDAHGEDVNSSILIAAENVSTYPGLKEPLQYLAVLKETAEQQGFATDVEPYEIGVGPKTLVRQDFHKDVGTRVMQQSTMAMLAHGYAVSITVIGGTEDEVEDLLDGMEFGTGKTAAKPQVVK
jgi:hypothetical protein